MPKEKIKEINKKYLLKAVESVREYYKARTEKKEELARKKWHKNCCKAFNVEKLLNTTDGYRLKELTCALKCYEDEKFIKVFETLGYRIVE